MEAMLDQLQSAPISNDGLVAFLRKQCEALSFQTGASVSFTAGLPDERALIRGTPGDCARRAGGVVERRAARAGAERQRLARPQRRPLVLTVEGRRRPASPPGATTAPGWGWPTWRRAPLRSAASLDVVERPRRRHHGSIRRAVRRVAFAAVLRRPRLVWSADLLAVPLLATHAFTARLLAVPVMIIAEIAIARNAVAAIARIGRRANMISIALADDHQVVTHSLKAYLESFPDLKVIGIASTGEELLARLDEWRPRVILQDLLMPGRHRRHRDDAPRAAAPSGDRGRRADRLDGRSPDDRRAARRRARLRSQGCGARDAPRRRARVSRAGPTSIPSIDRTARLRRRRGDVDRERDRGPAPARRSDCRTGTSRGARRSPRRPSRPTSPTCSRS